MATRPKLSLLQGALLGAVVAFILGARWAVVGHFGTDLPFWDEWDAEGTNLLSPWSQHHYTWAMLVDHHNEHRVVWSRLLTLGLTLANGQWDQRLECVVHALLPAAIATGFLLLAFRHLDRRWHLGLVVLLLVGFGLPIAWENVLRGFDSQQYFLIGLSFAAIVELPPARPWSGRFWLGAASVVAALGSMATGFLASVVVGGMLLGRWVQKRATFREILPALSVCTATTVVGWVSRVTVPYHAIYLAHTFQDFSLSFRHSLQWPGYGPTWSWMAVVMWLPWAWLTTKFLRNRHIGDQPLAPILVGLGGWVILQLLATAYGRGAGGPAPASRYEDTLMFGAAVNALALAWLRQYGQLRGAPREVLAVAALTWAITFSLATYANCVPIFLDDLPNEQRSNYYCVENTRQYLATGDPAYVNRDEIPYPGTQAYIDHLHAPGLISLLPASVRRPLAVTSAPDHAAYVESDSTPANPRPSPSGLSPATPTLAWRKTWGSYGANKTGEWESAPIRARRGWLKIELAGQPGSPGVSLQLRDVATGRTLAEVRADRRPDNTWRAAYVRAPHRPFVLVAQDHDPARWLAFSAPIEMGPLSYAAWRLTKHGLLLAELAGLLALALAWAESVRSRQV